MVLQMYLFSRLFFFPSFNFPSMVYRLLRRELVTSSCRAVFRGVYVFTYLGPAAAEASSGCCTRGFRKEPQEVLLQKVIDDENLVMILWG